jgi:hypothetical protein
MIISWEADVAGGCKGSLHLWHFDNADERQGVTGTVTTYDCCQADRAFIYLEHKA